MGLNVIIITADSREVDANPGREQDVIVLRPSTGLLVPIAEGQLPGDSRQGDYGTNSKLILYCPRSDMFGKIRAQ
jgi:hypothetical protein